MAVTLSLFSSLPLLLLTLLTLPHFLEPGDPDIPIYF